MQYERDEQLLLFFSFHVGERIRQGDKCCLVQKFRNIGTGPFCLAVSNTVRTYG